MAAFARTPELGAEAYGLLAPTPASCSAGLRRRVRTGRRLPRPGRPGDRRAGAGLAARRRRRSAWPRSGRSRCSPRGCGNSGTATASDPRHFLRCRNAPPVQPLEPPTGEHPHDLVRRPAGLGEQRRSRSAAGTSCSTHGTSFSDLAEGDALLEVLVDRLPLGLGHDRAAGARSSRSPRGAGAARATPWRRSAARRAPRGCRRPACSAIRPRPAAQASSAGSISPCSASIASRVSALRRRWPAP